LVEPRAVGGACDPLQLSDLIGDSIENGPACLEFRNLRFHFFGVALNEHLAEHAGGTLFRRDCHAVTGPGERPRPCVDS
jgi:hypothetical protein